MDETAVKKEPYITPEMEIIPIEREDFIREELDEMESKQERL